MIENKRRYYMCGRESPGLEFRIPGFKPGTALPLFGLNLFILIFGKILVAKLGILFYSSLF